MSVNISFRPKLLDTIKNYNLSDFFSDLSSGITVGVVALPLSMAFAIASGLKPEAGIFTAIVAGTLISILGGSKVQIGGPAGAFIVIIYGIVAKYGVSGLIVSSMMAGVILFAMGLLKLGSLVRFVPVSIVVGFTNGIAVLIALSQVKELLGLKIEKMPSEFIEQVHALASHIGTFDPTTIALAAASAVVVFGWPKVTKMIGNATLQRIPGSIIALVLGTAAVSVMQLPVATIGTKFGGIPSTLPAMTFPEVNMDMIKGLIGPGITIAILGAIESLLCARVADGLINDKHDSNQELMAQGVANFVAPLFGGFAATGTIARTVTNIRSGGKTPVAGVIHAITLLIIILAAAPLAVNVPLATLGAILLFVAYNMGEWHEFARMRHFPRSYQLVLMLTFLLTVVVDLTVAFEVGLVLAAFIIVTRLSQVTSLQPMSEVESFGHAKIGGEIEAYNLSGSLFFGSVHKLEDLLTVAGPQTKIVVLNVGGLINVDTSGLTMLRQVRQKLAEKGTRLLVAGAVGQPLAMMTKAGFVKELGGKAFFGTLEAAFDQAAKMRGQSGEEPALIYA